MFTQKFATFFSSYQRTAVWSSLNDNGEFFFRNGTRLSKDTLATMKTDCQRFLYMHQTLSSVFENMSNDDIMAAGHMFWLTRNRHGGSGFWEIIDGIDYSEALTDWAHSFGECSLYLGDDGLIYQFPA